MSNSEHRGLILVTFIAIIVALLPIILNHIDAYLYSLSTPTTETVKQSITTVTQTTSTVSEEIRMLKEEASSSTGSDTLIVKPASIVVKPGIPFTITMIVKFRHAQPYPYSSWELYYEVGDGVEEVEDKGNELVDERTLVREVIFKAYKSSTITVIFKYGKGCPYGTEEKVIVDVKVQE